jgi:cyanophycinase
MATAQTSGIIALLGGGPFTANDDLDRSLLSEVGAQQVVVMPTADAFENPADLVQAAQHWAERLGVLSQPVMVMTRSDAHEERFREVVAAARAIYLVGDSPIHLRSVLTDTPVWEAICAVVAAGGLVVGVGGSASALCDPMTDPRGGAFTIGLGLISQMAAATETETWTEERLHRTRELADVTVVELPTGSAAIRRSTGWELFGGAVVHGDLPD